MKSAFSIKWLQSIQPRKQRKFRANAPLHIKGEFLNAPLAKELKEKHKVRSTRVRKGDKVKVARGQFKGKIGEVENVDIDKERIFINGVELVKKEGGKVPYPVHPSNVIITSLVSDKRRFKRTGDN
jgi:large subunit ribosomal protein L24